MIRGEQYATASLAFMRGHSRALYYLMDHYHGVSREILDTVLREAQLLH